MAGVPILKENPRFPKGTVEMFLDMENLNWDGFVNYLIGVLLRSDSEERYIGFFAETPDEEWKCWQEFCKLVRSVGPVAIYYWSVSAEKVYIKKTIDRYETDPVVRERLNSSIDLQRLTLDSFAFPTHSDRLKDIAGSLGFKWRLKDWDGLLAMIRYRAYLDSGSTDIKARSDILTYNEDDCRAAMFVKDWLAANSP